MTLSIIPKQYQNMYTHDLILVQIFLASTKKRHQTPGAHMERQKNLQMGCLVKSFHKPWVLSRKEKGGCKIKILTKSILYQLKFRIEDVKAAMNGLNHLCIETHTDTSPSSWPFHPFGQIDLRLSFVETFYHHPIPNSPKGKKFCWTSRCISRGIWITMNLYPSVLTS